MAKSGISDYAIVRYITSLPVTHRLPVTRMSYRRVYVRVIVRVYARVIVSVYVRVYVRVIVRVFVRDIVRVY